MKLTGDCPFLASRAQAAIYRKLGRKVPVEPQSVEMAQYFWYFDSGKASRELGFSPRDPADTLRDTVKYIRDHLLGNRSLRRRGSLVARPRMHRRLAIADDVPDDAPLGPRRRFAGRASATRIAPAWSGRPPRWWSRARRW